MPRLVAVSLLAGLIPVLPASAFSDVSGKTSYSAAIEAMRQQGVIEGYADGTFKPGATINRAEFLAIILRGLAQDFEKNSEGLSCFPDVKAKDWFSAYVCGAREMGIIEGYPDGLFHPERDINFVEASKIIALAYKQEVQQGGSVWYEPYARALDGSKAIPPSIGTFDQRISRGEMVEMMWRIGEGKTDQPSKGYLNVKYPEVAINLSSDDVQMAKSCADLRAFSAEAQVSGGMGYGRDVMLMESDGVAAPTAGNMKASETPQAGGGADYSQTNVQVAGVDEGDIVKSDGMYLYIVSVGKVRIVKAVPGASMQVMSTIDLEENAFTPSDLYVDGNRLVVIGSRWTQGSGGPHIMEKRMGMSIWPGPWYGMQRAEARIYDVTNRANPTLERKVTVDGSTVSTRRIDDKLYLITNNPVRWGGPGPIPLRATEEDLLPSIEDSKTGEEPVARCGDVAILPHVPSPQYLTVSVIPLRSPTADVKSSVVLGSAENVYASLENLYIATTEWNYYWNAAGSSGTEKTNVFRFAYQNDGVDLEAQGSVPGHLLNQFSMDEHENVFRIATTINGQWMNERETPSTNNLYTLNMELERMGEIEDIAPGEQIYSVRFMGDRAYMVTFQRIDPFFVIDVGNARNPKILGKLKIPGYSDYLHPYDDTHIIGFGKEAVEAKEGNFAWYQGMKVAIFDVTDVENPKEMHKITIGDRGTESPLLHNHKALLFEKNRDLLAFPVSIAKIEDSQKTPGNERSAYGSPVFQGAQVYTISLGKGFELRGQITHYDADAFTKAGDHWYQGDRDIQRIVRIGESLYTVSNAQVQSHGEKSVTKQGEVTFQ